MTSSRTRTRCCYFSWRPTQSKRQWWWLELLLWCHPCILPLPDQPPWPPGSPSHVTPTLLHRAFCLLFSLLWTLHSLTPIGSFPLYLPRLPNLKLHHPSSHFLLLSGFTFLHSTFTTSHGRCLLFCLFCCPSISSMKVGPLFRSLLYPQHLGQCLEHSRNSINICWVNKHVEQMASF